MYITWVEEHGNDQVNDIDYPKGWSTGNITLHLACQEGAEEIYMLGFDGSDYNKPINNVYKGSKNYLLKIVVDLTRLTGITNLK